MKQFSLAVLVFLLFTPKVSTPPLDAGKSPGPVKTSDLVILSGGQGEERLKDENLLNLDDGAGYLKFEVLSLAASRAVSEPFEVKIWGQGIGGLSFFELTPLLGVFDNPQDAPDLRRSLLADDKSAGTDRQRLEESLKAPAISQKTLQQRTIALAQMRFFQISDFEHLFAEYQKQKRFAQGPLSSRSSQIGELFGQQGNLENDAAGWAKLIKVLSENNILTPVLHTRISSAADPKLIGYVRRIPREGVSKLGGQIFISANGLEAATIPASLEIEHEASWVATALAGVPTTLVSIMAGLVGTFGGALIGYRVFLYQQQYISRSDRQKKFEDKKIEQSKTIKALFKTDYVTLKNSQDPEEEKVKQIRDALIDEGIYAIMLTEEIEAISNICSPKYQGESSRVNALEAVLRRNFNEFMASD